MDPRPPRIAGVFHLSSLAIIIMAATASSTLSRLHKIRLGADQPDIFVISEVDARLEAEQCLPDRQIYADGSLISIRPGDVVIDVGANVGSFARTASLLAAGPGGKVIAVEPLPEAFQVGPGGKVIAAEPLPEALQVGCTLYLKGYYPSIPSVQRGMLSQPHP